ncbi:interferon-induced GTP-binding protein Mx, partial [Metarhizium majus ARSEF 297]
MAFIELQSEDHRDLLDTFDRLRSGGICKHVHLPEIIVCGGRSAGKSSVLEAISGISFLTEDNACTRFTTELVLRRQDTPAVKISINPGLERAANEKRRSGIFTVPVSFDKPDIETIIGEAKEAMGLSEAKMFSSDILRVELCGPTQPHLTVVDLPGIFRADGQDQMAQDAETVRALVRHYIKRSHSIILAVVSAENYSYLGDITEIVRELDPNGSRTLGLITKPDVLEPGSDRESVYAHLAKNTELSSQLGWHVLKNRDHKVRDSPSLERNEDEERFFSKGIWSSVDQSYLGIKSLMPRLSNILRNQILQQVPSIIEVVDRDIDRRKAQLERLGKPRCTISEQRKYLMQVSREFTTLMKAAVDGEYNDAFFGSAKTDEGYRRRLRARIQNTLTSFEKEMRERGQSRVIVDDSGTRDRKLPGDHQWRSAFVNEVMNIVRRSRTRGLPGTFNSQIIRELFVEQCRPWQTIAMNVKHEILGIVDDIAQAIVDHVAADETTRGVYHLVSNETDSLKAHLGAKFQEILKQYVCSHPITYNSYLLDMVQKEQERRTHEQIEETVKKLVGSENFKEEHRVKIHPLNLCDSLQRSINVDMERSGAEMATDYMLAYYKLALEKFVDDISVLAVEQCLLEKLPTLFLPEAVMDLPDHDVRYFIRERDTAHAERARCADKLAVLETERRVLARLDTRRSPGVAQACAGENLPVSGIPRSYATDSVTVDEARPYFPRSPSPGNPGHGGELLVEPEGGEPAGAEEPGAPEPVPELEPETEAAEAVEEPEEPAADEPLSTEAPTEETQPAAEETEEDLWGFRAKKDKWRRSWGDAPVEEEATAVPLETEDAKSDFAGVKKSKRSKRKKSREDAPALSEVTLEIEPVIVPESQLAYPWGWAR